MQRTSIVELLASEAARPGVTVCGWVRTRRDSKGFAFLELNDGSCLANVQCIVDEGVPAWSCLEGVNTGTSVCVHGDSPSAVAMARAIRGRLDADGFDVASFIRG